MLKRTKINKATGYDHIPPKMVKMCSNELSVTLMELLSYAFKQKRFPDEMKNAEITTIFKKKDDMNKEIYRTISILALFSKVFESIIAEQLMEHFKDIFNDMLCAYRKKYGCEHVLKHIKIYLCYNYNQTRKICFFYNYHQTQNKMFLLKL